MAEHVAGEGAVHRWPPVLSIRGWRWLFRWLSYLIRNRLVLIPAETWADWAIELHDVRPEQRDEMIRIYRTAQKLRGLCP